MMIFQLKTRITSMKRSQFTNVFDKHIVFLHFINRVDFDNIHQSQQFDALIIQIDMFLFLIRNRSFNKLLDD